MSGPEELRALVEALKEAEETLRLVEHPAFPDPAHHDEVKRLGRRIGFGALMSTASAGWREVLEERGDPLGGEFVAGPCHSTVVYALRVIRTALTRAESSLASPAGMEGWMPIETAPKPSEWLRHASMKALVACITPSYEENDCEGEPSGPLKVRWAQVVTLCSSGWMVNTYGWAGINGHAEFRVDGATHWMPLSFPLPAAPRGEAK